MKFGFGFSTTSSRIALSVKGAGGGGTTPAPLEPGAPDSYDPYWDQVKILTVGSGADNSTVFPNAAPVAFANLTRNGDTKNDTDIDVYGQSILFDGTNDYLSVSATQQTDNGMKLNNGVEFCWEAYISVADIARSNCIFSVWRSFIGQIGGVEFFIDANGKLRARGSDSNSGIVYGVDLTGTSTLEPNTVYHVALSVSGSPARTWRIFLNGRLEATGVSDRGVASGSPAFKIGQNTSSDNGGSDFMGSMNHIRFTVGAARYTSNFAPPGAPLPQIGPPAALKEISTAVMDSPPVVTQTVQSASTISGARQYISRSPVFRHIAPPRMSHTSLGSAYQVISSSSGNDMSSAYWTVEWDTTCSVNEIRMLRSNAAFSILVDGRPIQSSTMTTTAQGDAILFKLDFSADAQPNKKRLIRLSGFNLAFGGVFSSTDGVITYPLEREGRPLAFWFGDSYTQGTNAQIGVRHFAPLVSRMLDFDHYHDGIGATGWNSTGNNLPTSRNSNYLKRIPAPAVIITAFGYNDYGAPNSVAANYATWLADAQAAWPGVPIISLSPWMPLGPTTALNTISAALKTGVEAGGGSFVDISGVSYPINADNVHPLGNSAHVTLAEGIAPLLNELSVIRNIRANGHSTPSTLQPATRSLLTRMTAQPDATRIGLIDDCIRSLSEASVFERLDGMWMLAAHDSQAARLNWVADRYNAEPWNIPTFTTDKGYTGDGTSSGLDTGLNFADAANFQQNSGHLASAQYGGATQSGQNSAYSMGGANTSATLMGPRSPNNGVRGRINGSSTQSYEANPIVMDRNGFRCISRTGANAQAAYAGTTLVDGGNVSGSVAKANSKLAICGIFNAGTFGSGISNTVQFAAIGSGINAEQEAAYCNAIETYLNAIGANS